MPSYYDEQGNFVGDEHSPTSVPTPPSDPPKDVIRLEVELTEAPRNTILLGYEIAHADVDGRSIRIAGSGEILRFTVYNTETGKRIKEYDLNLKPIAAEVFHR